MSDHKAPPADPRSHAGSGVEPPPYRGDMEGPALPADEAARRRRRVAFAVLLTGTVCLGMGQTIVFAALPPVARTIGLSELQTGAIFSVSAVMWVVFSPIWGSLSDRVGRRPIILMGLAGFTVSLVMFTAAIRLGVSGWGTPLAVYALMIATRCVYGAIGSGAPAASQAYLADRTSPEERTGALAGFTAAFGFGQMLGPGFASAVAVFGLLAPFHAMAVVGALVAGFVFARLPEKSPPRRRERKAGPSVSVFDRRVRGFLGYAFLTGIVIAVPLQATAFYIIDRFALAEEAAAQLVGVALTASAMAALFSQLVLVQRYRLAPRDLMRYAPLVVAPAHILIAISPAYGPLVFGLMASGLGLGMAQPGFAGAASLAVERDEQGAVAGLSNGAGAAGFALSPFIAFPLYDLAPFAPFLMTASLMAGLALFAWRSRHIAEATPTEKAAG
ncbi:MAG: MFS transporter [Pseudomonadota bacterium]